MPKGLLGDLIYHDGSIWRRLPAGTDGQLLASGGASGVPGWESVSMPMGEISLTDNATATTITTTDTATRFDETTALNTGMDFDSPSAGRLRYTGALTGHFHMGCTMSAKGAGANDVMEAVIIKNATVNGSGEYSTGTILSHGKITQKLGPAGDVGSTAIHVMAELAQNDYIELFILNTSDTDDITIVDMNLFAVALTQG